MMHDARLEALKDGYEFWIKNVKAGEEVLQESRRALQRAYAELDLYLNKAENSFQDTDAEGF